MRFTMALAGIATLVVVALLVRDLAGPRAGLLAAGIVAVYPNLWAADALIMSETLAALFTALALYFAYRLWRAPTNRNAIGAGVACALATLSRGELLLLVVFVVLPVLVGLRTVDTRRRIRLFGIVVVTLAVVVAPWVAFNLSRFEEPVLVSNGDAGVLAGANCDITYYGDEIGYWNGFCTSGDLSEEESVRARRKRSAAFTYMRDHVERIPLVVAARVSRLWGVFKPFSMAEDHRNEGRPVAVSIAGWIAFWAVAAAAVVGGVALRRAGVPIAPLVGVLVAMTLTAAVFYGHPRFRLPADIAIVVFAAVGIDRLWARHRRRQTLRPAAVG
jgi:4-amino-4-deoxy-L-arabinose transferase-like glycosyltransferase